MEHLADIYRGCAAEFILQPSETTVAVAMGANLVRSVVIWKVDQTKDLFSKIRSLV